jgi:carbon-monoxide dehydrogenase medium subunit
VKPVRFAYYRPDSVTEAVACLRACGGQARALAGGQSLLALMNRREARPAALVDLGQLAELRYLVEEDGALRVGALTTHAQMEAAGISAAAPGFALMTEAARLIGHAPIRSRGTVGGSIAHADPRSEWCLLAVLLGAQVTLRTLDGIRIVPAAEFFTGPYRTAAGWDELVTEIRFPRPAPGTAIAEFGPQSGQFPLVAAGASVALGPDGAITQATIALGGVAGRPVRAHGTERALRGHRSDQSLSGLAARTLASELNPATDKEASAADRIELAAVVLDRALRTAIARYSGWQKAERGTS